MNGYFQLDIQDNGTFIRIYSPTEDGQPVSYNDVAAYLSEKNISDYNIKTLNDAISLASEPGAEAAGCLLCKKLPYEESELMMVDYSMDYMTGTAVFYPPSTNGNRMSKDDILLQLKSEKIVHGIREDVIEDFLKNPVYCTKYVIATGTKPVPGTDASIEYFFETEKNLTPKLNEDGTVNYHDLNMISPVAKDQLLARLTPDVPGSNGTNIFGDVTKTNQANKLKLQYGNNIRINEARTEIYSMVDGHANLTNGKVFVSDVYEVPADVDNSTGDIDYTGSVNIKGNVNTGFRVKSGGDIIIGGVVEGASLEAKGNIIIAGGVHGMSKAVIQADESITAKFFENAQVISKESVNADSIIHSDVSAASTVRVKGKKGFITGGHIRAGFKVDSQSLGSTMGALTLVEVGADPNLKKHQKELEDKIRDLNKEKEKVEPTILGIGEKVARGMELPEDKMAFLKNVALLYQELKKDLSEVQEEYEKVTEEIESCQGANVEVAGWTYPGVTVTISDVSKTMTEKRASCKFVRDRGDVKIV